MLYSWTTRHRVPQESTGGLHQQRGTGLANVRLQEGESFEAMLRRFTKRVQQEGIISEERRRQHFEPPCSLRKKRAAAKRRKSIKATLKAA